MKRSLVVIVGVLGLLSASVGVAKAPAATKVEGLREVYRFVPTRGFVDSPMALDGKRKRLALVNSDAATFASIMVVELKTRRVVRNVNISSFSVAPVALDFARGTDLLFVTARDAQDRMSAALIDFNGKIQKSFGPATDIVQTTFAGADAVVEYDVGADKKGLLRHSITAYRTDSGKKIGKTRSFVADETGRIESLGFEINQWVDGYTTIIGMKDGQWDPKENMRLRDFESRYDVAKGTFGHDVVVTNVIEHTKAMKALAEHQNEGIFAKPTWDRSELSVYEGVGKRAVKLAEPLHHYDVATLRYQPLNGGLFLGMTIDPVHPDAAAQRSAVAPWLDFYSVAKNGTTARRVGRLLALDGRKRLWTADGNYIVVLTGHRGFGRGGTEAVVYKYR